MDRCTTGADERPDARAIALCVCPECYLLTHMRLQSGVDTPVGRRLAHGGF